MKKHRNESKADLKRLRPPPHVGDVKAVLSGLDTPVSDDLICEIHGHLHRHHVLLNTTNRASPSKLRKELLSLIRQTEKPTGR